MSLKPRFCTNLLSFKIVNRLFLNNHKTIDQVILSRARISHIFCIDYNKCFKSSRAFCCVDIRFHKFYFFLSFSFWFFIYALSQRDHRYDFGLLGGAMIVMRTTLKEGWQMSERDTTEVPFQPQVILKTSKKLKLSCLHIGVPFF